MSLFGDVERSSTHVRVQTTFTTGDSTHPDEVEEAREIRERVENTGPFLEAYTVGIEKVLARLAAERPKEIQPAPYCKCQVEVAEPLQQESLKQGSGPCRYKFEAIGIRVEIGLLVLPPPEARAELRKAVEAEMFAINQRLSEERLEAQYKKLGIQRRKPKSK